MLAESLAILFHSSTPTASWASYTKPHCTPYKPFPPSLKPLTECYTVPPSIYAWCHACAGFYTLCSLSSWAQEFKSSKDKFQYLWNAMAERESTYCEQWDHWGTHKSICNLINGGVRHSHGCSLVDFACLSQHMHSCLATTCSCGPMSSFLKPLKWPHEVVLVLELSKGFPTVWSPHPHIFYLQLTLSPYVALHVNSTGHHITVSPVLCLIHL